MPAYNHTKDGVVEQTQEHIRMYQSGDLHCNYDSCSMNYIGRSSFKVQEHFEEVHGFTFGDE